GMALVWAQDRAYLAFILVLLAMVWNGLTSFRLNRMISATEQAKIASDDLNIDTADEVAYSDGVKMAGLLHDSETGLRGRPDQVLRVDGRYVPVEQKTGKVPSSPHLSHRLQLLAYLQLVGAVSEQPPEHGLLRYGPHDAHLVPWNAETKAELIEHVGALHSAMAAGTADRNHERVGKCRSCSRRQGCDQRLDQ
ncbi:MAG TPA: PD-(D/E)XK nuclease family protein, partial [Candidatus Poseidoniales archaeon]|nr:PD-(D/E)XK nuclease family protein [Candidatus Poseidoniales archaeon]